MGFLKFLFCRDYYELMINFFFSCCELLGVSFEVGIEGMVIFGSCFFLWGFIFEKDEF